jgi:hypothetical protein
MKNKQIVFMDGFDNVIDETTQKVIFTVTTPFGVIQDEVIDNVVNLWNKTHSIEELDDYLLDESNCTQEDREIIVESLFEFYEGENFKRNEKAKEMCIEPFAFFTNHLNVLADENIERHLKNESLFGFLITKVLGKSLEQWHTIINGDIPIDFQMVHNGLEQVKLFNQVYDRFKVLFDAVVKHIFDNWVIENNPYGRTITPYFCDGFAPNNLMVNSFDLLVDGFDLKAAYREYSPAKADSKTVAMGVNFVVV